MHLFCFEPISEIKTKFMVKLALWFHFPRQNLPAKLYLTDLCVRQVFWGCFSVHHTKLWLPLTTARASLKKRFPTTGMRTSTWAGMLSHKFKLQV